MTDDRLHTRRCECDALDCTAEIEVTWEEDDAVDHSGENLWIVAPGHQLLGAREAVVVSARERFSVVRVVEEWPSRLPPSSRATTARMSLGGLRRRLLSRLDVTPASDRVTAERERLKGGPVKLGVNGPSFLRTRETRPSLTRPSWHT